MKHLLNIKALDDDTGEVGIIHVMCESRGSAAALALDLVMEADADPEDIEYVEVDDDWACTGHDDDNAICSLLPDGLTIFTGDVNVAAPLLN